MFRAGARPRKEKQVGSKEKERG
jgi:hypothetical protein